MSKFIPVVAMIVTVVIAAVNIWAAIKIKFAPDKATLIREMKTTLWKVVTWGTNLACVANIIWFFIFWPVDRLFMFVVIYNSFALFFSFAVSKETKIVNAIVALRNFDESLLDLIDKLKKTDALIIERTGIGKTP